MKTYAKLLDTISKVRLKSRNYGTINQPDLIGGSFLQASATLTSRHPVGMALHQITPDRWKALQRFKLCLRSIQNATETDEVEDLGEGGLGIVLLHGVFEQAGTIHVADARNSIPPVGISPGQPIRLHKRPATASYYIVVAGRNANNEEASAALRKIYTPMR